MRKVQVIPFFKEVRVNAIKIEADSKCNTLVNKLYFTTLQIGFAVETKHSTASQPVKPDDHSEAVPLLPIPNRTVKCLSADDSADSRVKVGHRQANIKQNARSTDRAFLSPRTT